MLTTSLISMKCHLTCNYTGLTDNNRRDWGEVNIDKNKLKHQIAYTPHRKPKEVLVNNSYFMFGEKEFTPVYV